MTRDAGVVDEDVKWPDAPEFALDSLDIGDIKWQRVGRSKRRSNFRGARLEFIVASRNERHLGAGLGERDCAGETFPSGEGIATRCSCRNNGRPIFTRLQHKRRFCAPKPKGHHVIGLKARLS